MYDSTTAHFMQEDTYRGNEYDPISLNLYTYCNNEPSDPTGHYSVEADGTIHYSMPQPVSNQSSSASKGNTAIVNVSSGNLNVRSGGGTDNSVIGKLSKGAEVTIYKQVGGWTEIYFADHGGWAKTDYLQIQSSGNKPTDKVTSNIERAKADAGGDGVVGISSGNQSKVETKPINNVYTKEEADKYINQRVWGMAIGYNLYNTDEISNLPTQITYKDKDYTYTYMLDEHNLSFMGVKLGVPEALKNYEYKLAYTDAPKVLTGTVYIGGFGKGRTKAPNNWGNKDTLQDHVERHGPDFGTKDPNKYTEMANDFYNNRSKYQVKVDENGVTRVYDSNTNTFGSYNLDGTTKTFYKPTGRQKYFDSQPGK